MCKVMVMFGIQNGLKAKQFMFASKADMTKSDNHGLGYAAIDGEGNMFSERFFDVSKAFLKPLTELAKYQGVIKESVPTVLDATEYSSTGNINFENVKSIIYHTRWATCARTFQNVHPFIIDDTALIHNGVINNSHKLTNVISTCDSETILNEYLKNDVANDSSKIQQTTDALEGYWGVATLGKQSDGRRILDVFKYNAPLFIAQVEEIGGFVICTSEDIIKNTCEKLKWKKPLCFPLFDNKLLRVDAITGEPISVTDINRTYAPRQSYSSRRFAREQQTSECSNWLYSNREKESSTSSSSKTSEIDMTVVYAMSSVLLQYCLSLTQDEQSVLNSLDYDTKLKLLYDAYNNDDSVSYA